MRHEKIFHHKSQVSSQYFPYSVLAGWQAVPLCKILMLQVPLQCTSALLLMFSADWADQKLQQANVAAITALYFLLVLLAATQDIAVDGWALTLLSKKHVG